MSGFKNVRRRVMARGTALALAIGVIAGSASAGALEAARAAGYIGERPDGYVAIVSNSAPGSIQQLVQEINAQRRAVYETAAAQSGEPLNVIELRGGQRIAAGVPSGTWLMSQAGQWYQK